MLHEHIQFFKTSLVKKQDQAFARGEFSLLVLVVDSLLASAEERQLAEFMQPGIRVCGHGSSGDLQVSVFEEELFATDTFKFDHGACVFAQALQRNDATRTEGLVEHAQTNPHVK